MFSADFPLHKSIDWEILGTTSHSTQHFVSFRDHLTIDDVGPPLLFLGSDAGTTRCAVGDLLQGWPTHPRPNWWKRLVEIRMTGAMQVTHIPTWLWGVFLCVTWPDLQLFLLTPQMLQWCHLKGQTIASLPVIFRPLLSLNQKMSGLPGRFSDVPAIHRLRSCQIA